MSECALSANYSSWMTDIHDVIKDRHLAELKIPGTHNSATSHISTSSKIGADAYEELGDYRSKLLSAIMYIPWVDQQVVKLAKTHSKCISEQLYDGIRFFDLRVSLEDDNEFYATHSLLGARYQDIFLEIRNFIEHHPKELIILNFHYLYKKAENSQDRWFTVSECDQFMQLVTSYLGKSLIPFVRARSDKRTLGELLDEGQVIIHMHKITNRMRSQMNALYQDKIWTDDSVKRSWKEASDCQTRITHMSDAAITRNNYHLNTIQVQSGALTPTLGSIMRLETYDLVEMAERLNREIDVWLHTTEGQATNALIIDHYDQTEGKKVVEHVIRMNCPTAFGEMKSD